MAGGVNTDWAKLRIFQHLGRCDLEQNKADLIFCWLHRVLICCSNSKTVYLIPHRGFSVLLFIQCDMAVYDMMLWRGKCGVNLCIFQAEGEAVDLNCCSPHPCKNTCYPSYFSSNFAGLKNKIRKHLQYLEWPLGVKCENGSAQNKELNFTAEINIFTACNTKSFGSL